MGDHRAVFRRAVVVGRILGQHFSQAHHLHPSAPGRQAGPGQAHTFTATHQQDRQRQRQNARALGLGRQGIGAVEPHRGPLIAPQHNRLRDLPFAFAYELRVAHGAAAVVDHAAAVAHLCRTVLPEIITRASAPAPVVAQQDGTGQILGTGQQRGQARGLILG